MSHWNYRVIELEGELSVHEVYYDDQGRPTSCTVRGVGIHGSNLDELKADLKRYVSAFSKPVLKFEDLIAKPKGDSNDS